MFVAEKLRDFGERVKPGKVFPSFGGKRKQQVAGGEI
jgi:hypothetical protein